MPCKSCSSNDQRNFLAEIAIHFPGPKHIDKPHVLVLPELVVCLDCGSAEFVICEEELRLLGKGDAAAG